MKSLGNRPNIELPVICWGKGADRPLFAELLLMDLSKPLIGKKMQTPDGDLEILTAGLKDNKLHLLLDAPKQRTAS